MQVRARAFSKTHEPGVEWRPLKDGQKARQEISGARPESPTCMVADGTNNFSAQLDDDDATQACAP